MSSKESIEEIQAMAGASYEEYTASKAGKLPVKGATYDYIEPEPLYEWIRVTSISGRFVYYDIEDSSGDGQILISEFFKEFKESDEERD